MVIHRLEISSVCGQEVFSSLWVYSVAVCRRLRSRVRCRASAGFYDLDNEYHNIHDKHHEGKESERLKKERAKFNTD